MVTVKLKALSEDLKVVGESKSKTLISDPYIIVRDHAPTLVFTGMPSIILNKRDRPVWVEVWFLDTSQAPAPWRPYGKAPMSLRGPVRKGQVVHLDEFYISLHGG